MRITSDCVLREFDALSAVGYLRTNLVSCEFDAKKLPERWVHASVTCLPHLPYAQSLVEERGGGRLR